MTCNNYYEPMDISCIIRTKESFVIFKLIIICMV